MCVRKAWLEGCSWNLTPAVSLLFQSWEVSIVYPSYSKFFSEIDGKNAMYFWKPYPSPLHLQGKTTEELMEEIREISKILAGIDAEIEKLRLTFEYKLTSMPGIGTAFASKLIAEIGDIRRFRNADKLARYAGVAPVKFSSAGKGKEQSSRQRNRQLHGLFYMLVVTMVAVPKSGIPNHPVLHRYYMRKISEGKTKSQALFCIMRRLVNIIYGMMKNRMEYREQIVPNQLQEEQ